MIPGKMFSLPPQSKFNKILPQLRHSATPTPSCSIPSGKYEIC